MYYEVYVDILFLVNFLMDYLLLLLVNRMLKCYATHGRMFLGALLGAGLTCMITILYLPYTWIKLVLFHFIINTIMIRVGLSIRTKEAFVKAVVMLYIGVFFMGGILESVRPYIKSGSLFFGAAVIGYHVALGLWNVMEKIRDRQERRCKVMLCHKDRQMVIWGLIDTGNELREPVSCAPVSVIDKKTIMEFLGTETIAHISYIPYHSVGKSEGVMPAIQIEKMAIVQEKMHWIKNPWIGISDAPVSSQGEYCLILHTDLL